MEADGPELQHVYPSLYLNIDKCHEDLGDFINAVDNYQSALHYAASLPDDGYSNMIRSGIHNGIERTTATLVILTPSATESPLPKAFIKA